MSREQFEKEALEYAFCALDDMNFDTSSASLEGDLLHQGFLAGRTLTDEQWEELGEIILHISDIDDALTALGFRRASEIESAP